MAEIVVEIIEQAFDGVAIAQDGPGLTARLGRPEALTRLPDALDTMGEQRASAANAREELLQELEGIAEEVVPEIAPKMDPLQSDAI